MISGELQQRINSKLDTIFYFCIQLIHTVISTTKINNTKGILFACIPAFLWGFLPIAIKVAVNKVDPITVVWVRFFLAFLMLLTFFLFTDRKKILQIFKEPLGFIIAAIGLAANYTGYAMGISYTSPSNAQVFIQMGPVLLAIAGIVLFKEKLSIRQMSGFLLAIVGFYLFYTDQNENPVVINKDYFKGVLWVLFGAVSWAVYAVMQKKLSSRFHSQQLNLFVFGFAALIYIPFADISTLIELSTNYKWLMLFLGFNTFAAYGGMALALKYAEANKVSIVFTINPLITFIVMTILATFDVSWIDPEHVSYLGLMGGGLVLIGALMVIIKKRRN